MDRPPNKLDYQQLAIFDALLEECSVTRAAARMNTTQPTVSAVLKKLRKHFDDPLFVRAQRGVAPTAKAQSMAKEVRALLDQLDALGSENEFDPKVQARHFSIAARDLGQRVVLAPFTKLLHEKFPKVRLSMHLMSIEEAVDRMARATIDAAVMSLRYAPDSINSQRLISDDYFCVVDARSELAKKSALTVRDLEEHEHVSVSASAISLGDPFSQFFAAEKVNRTVKFSADGFLMIPHLLQGTECIGVMPESFLQCSPVPLKAFPMPVDFPQLNLGILWNDRVQNDPGNRWLREQIVSMCEEMEDARAHRPASPRAVPQG